MQTTKVTEHNVKQWLQFVNDQINYHQRQIDRIDRRATPDAPEYHRVRENHQLLSARFHEFAQFLNELMTLPLEQSSELVSPHLHFLPEDLQGLPAELLAEINISDSDKLEMAIYDALRKTGGTLSVDKLLIQIYRDTGDIHSRSKLLAKLYRMVHKNQLTASSEHRGVYTLPEYTEKLPKSALEKVGERLLEEEES